MNNDKTIIIMFISKLKTDVRVMRVIKSLTEINTWAC